MSAKSGSATNQHRRDSTRRRAATIPKPLPALTPVNFGGGSSNEPGQSTALRRAGSTWTLYKQHGRAQMAQVGPFPSNSVARSSLRRPGKANLAYPFVGPASTAPVDVSGAQAFFYFPLATRRATDQSSLFTTIPGICHPRVRASCMPTWPPTPPAGVGAGFGSTEENKL